MIIGLTGKKGAGKTTIANYLVKTYGFIKLSFARRLKEIIRDEFGILHMKYFDEYYKPDMPSPKVYTPDEIYQKLIRYAKNIPLTTGKEEMLKSACFNISYLIAQYVNNLNVVDKRNEYARLLYQHVGTSFYRAIDPDFWINEVIEKIRDDDLNYVIDDIRFPNEYFSLKKNFKNRFIFILIKSPDTEMQEDNHESESYYGILQQYADRILINYKDGQIFKNLSFINQNWLETKSTQQDL